MEHGGYVETALYESHITSVKHGRNANVFPDGPFGTARQVRNQPLWQRAQASDLAPNRVDRLVEELRKGRPDPFLAQV
jgi:hypothetical protein